MDLGARMSLRNTGGCRYDTVDGGLSRVISPCPQIRSLLKFGFPPSCCTSRALTMLAAIEQAIICY